MTDLCTKRCAPCEGGVPALTPEEAQELLEQVEGWTLHADGKEIQREFQFKNFYETMAFVNAIAWMAHREDHHPDMAVGYKTCRVRYSTHALGGLSENDFICASKVNALLRA